MAIQSASRFVAGLLFLWPILLAGAQEPDVSAPAETWLQARQSEFAQYRFERQVEKPVDLVLEPRSILNWTNPERGSGSGAVFLWTDAGLPQMIACAFELGGSVKHEFHSLSTDPIAASRGGQSVHRFGPGLEWKELADGPSAAEQRTLRLVQMRRQAERFAVSVGGRDKWATTRLLPQPVFRSPAESASDIGVFTFVQATDPECLLLLTATPGKPWRYALTRQSKWALKATLDETPIWEAAPTHRPEAKDPETPFLVISQPTGAP
jgi:hypothetical protein